jgi:hypothetical protein
MGHAASKKTIKRAYSMSVAKSVENNMKTRLRGRMALKLILRKWCGWVRTGVTWRLVAGHY